MHSLLSAHVVSSRLALRPAAKRLLPVLRTASTGSNPPPPAAEKRTAFPSTSFGSLSPPPASASSASASASASPKSSGSQSGATGAKPKQNWVSYAVGAGAVIGGGGLFYFMGKPDDEQPVDEYSKDIFPVAYFNRAAKRIDNLQKYYTEPSAELLLPPPLPAPYQRPFTLVIELEDTLVHSNWNRETGWRTVKRPGLEYFLGYLSEFFEIVIFTKQTVTYAAPILDKVDPSNYIMYRLYRDATRYENGKYFKDLSRLNRDLSRVIVLESDASRVYQGENVIQLPPWKGDMSDKELLAFVPFLETLAMSGASDVRPVVKAYEGTHIPTAFAENQRRIKQSQRVEPPARGLGALFKGKGGPDLQEQQAQQHKQFAQVMQQRQQQQQQQPPPPPQQQPEQAGEQGKSGGIWGWFK